jgi:hypothetical protein
MSKAVVSQLYDLDVFRMARRPFDLVADAKQSRGFFP